MTIGSVIDVRRKLLCGALSLFGIAASGAAIARSQPRVRRSRDELLLDEAIGWIALQFGRHGDLLVGPISTLQRRFGLDYGPALALAARLEEAQVWTVFRDTAGMRCARRVRTA